MKINVEHFNNKCPVCESLHLVLVQAALDLVYLKCQSCGYEFQKPGDEAPSESFIKAQTLYYEEDNLIFSRPVRSINWRRSLTRLKIVKKFIKSGRLLEIGPGTGEFLQLASRDGFQVEAVETSHRLAKYLREELKFKTHESTLEDFVLENKQYDSIYSSHVIEHVVDPILYLSTAKKCVIPGGYFFIMTPNGDCWEHALARRAWSMYTPAHLHIFTAESLKKCLLKAGWNIKSIHTPEYSIDWVRTIISLIANRTPGPIPSPGANIKRVPDWLSIAGMSIISFLLSPLALLQSQRKKGGELFIIAQRPLKE